ncbi:hypothetical protein Tco_0194310 [Tanacetum coccineum]
MSQPANDDFSQHLSDGEESNHEDASDTGTAPKQQQQVIPQTTAISNIKLPILKKEEYDIWADVTKDMRTGKYNMEVTEYDDFDQTAGPLYGMLLGRTALIKCRSKDDFSQHLSDGEESNHEDASDTEGVKYDIWTMEMEHYLEYIDNEVWKVIQNGNSKKRISTGKDGVVRVLSPVTAAEIQAVEKERKAKNILLMGHVLKNI